MVLFGGEKGGGEDGSGVECFGDEGGLSGELGIGGGVKEGGDGAQSEEGVGGCHCGGGWGRSRWRKFWFGCCDTFCARTSLRAKLV